MIRHYLSCNNEMCYNTKTQIFSSTKHTHSFSSDSHFDLPILSHPSLVLFSFSQSLVYSSCRDNYIINLYTMLILCKIILWWLLASLLVCCFFLLLSSPSEYFSMNFFHRTLLNMWWGHPNRTCCSKCQEFTIQHKKYLSHPSPWWTNYA